MTTKKSTKRKPKTKKAPDLKFGFDGKFKKWSEIRDEIYGDRSYSDQEEPQKDGPERVLTIAQELIAEECDAIKNLLIRKNNDYGNSALEEGGVFSDLGPCEAIRVRIDDKLKRIKNLRDKYLFDKEEDTIADLIGYLILLRVAERHVGSEQSWLDDWMSKSRADKE